MINAKFFKDDKTIVKVELDGHAGYSTPGFDIVCAGCSVLTQAIAYGIHDILEVKCKLEVKDGYAMVDITECNKADKRKSQNLLQTLKLGVSTLEEQYAQYVKVEELEYVKEE